jgi:hypothetical protein
MLSWATLETALCLVSPRMVAGVAGQPRAGAYLTRRKTEL